MDAHMQTAEMVRQACIAAALQAYEEAGVSGLCHEGRYFSQRRTRTRRTQGWRGYATMATRRRKGAHAITLSCGAVADGRLPPRWLAR